MRSCLSRNALKSVQQLDVIHFNNDNYKHNELKCCVVGFCDA